MTDTVPSSDTAFHARYGAAPEAADAMAWNPTIAALLAHRSVRRYDDARPVTDDMLRAIVAAGQSAATSSNLQIWSVVAVRDPARKAALAECAGGQRHVAQAPLFLVWLADFARLRQLAGDHAVPLDGQDYLEAGVLGCVDAALAAQNAMVAAESLGLGGVYIGGIRNKPEAVAEILNLPPHVFAVFGMCLGYPAADDNATVKPRLPQAAVLHHETYDLTAQRLEVTRYEERVNAFYANQGMGESWVGRALARMASPQSLTGRDRLSEAFRNLGYPLK
ncbi:NADPH-dependent oxidoreductase [Achromobacter sp. GG226]|uniref:NADPH-dependent oxidoreductase n=1 Tax=Verticiella alkaliphila TaxID=2779529 RepID=UPI001C0C28AC|nr:NADPH-dependent oxidoreductase [Verticiella sp. GG226]MBU4609560.1 NADPH-dependent oxidoreductase [Verticiella sp. GG226]